MPAYHHRLPQKMRIPTMIGPSDDDTRQYLADRVA